MSEVDLQCEISFSVAPWPRDCTWSQVVRDCLCFAMGIGFVIDFFWHQCSVGYLISCFIGFGGRASGDSFIWLDCLIYFSQRLRIGKLCGVLVMVLDKPMRRFWWCARTKGRRVEMRLCGIEIKQREEYNRLLPEYLEANNITSSGDVPAQIQNDLYLSVVG
ncbi:hypothetical protein AKJ16_DCAP18622 [Drosera capensis]